MSERGSSESYHSDLEKRLADVLANAGWQVKVPIPNEAGEADIEAQRGDLRYVIEVKAAPDVRRPILQALLASACLRARRHAAILEARPLAVVCAPRLSEAALQDLREYAQMFLGDCAYGFLDSRGRVELHGEGLEGVSAPGAHDQHGPDRPASSSISMVREGSKWWRVAPEMQGMGADELQWRRPVELFGDLGRWIIKVLLAGRIREDYLRAPRVSLRSAAQLAEVADVSAASAWRQVHALREAGYLEEQRDGLKLVRVGDLLRQWARAGHHRAGEIRARWLLPPADGEAELRSALLRYMQGGAPRGEDADSARPRPRVCLSLHSACRHLGLGIVQGIPSSIYVEEVFPRVLQEFGLCESAGGEKVDVHICVPRHPKSVFRALVVREGVPAADAVQCWLDLQGHPARGEEQAREIWDRVLASLEE